MSDQKYELYFLDGPRRGTSITVSKPHSWLELSKPEFIRYKVTNIGGALFAVCEMSDKQFMSIVREAMLRHI